MRNACQPGRLALEAILYGFSVVQNMPAMISGLIDQLANTASTARLLRVEWPTAPAPIAIRTRLIAHC